jgi:hypothetical protein
MGIPIAACPIVNRNLEGPPAYDGFLGAAFCE